MKKYLLINAIVALTCINTYSQIVIERTDLYDSGDAIPQIRYTSPDNNGTPYTDLFEQDLIFSDLSWSKEIDTIRFLSATENDINQDFPDADFAFLTEQGFLVFCQANDEYIKYIGIITTQPITGEPMSLTFDTPIKIKQFPTEHQGSLNSQGIASHKECLTDYSDIIPTDFLDDLLENFDTAKIEMKFTVISSYDEYGSLEMSGREIINGNFDYLRETRTFITYTNLLLRNIGFGVWIPVGEYAGDQLPMDLPMIDSVFTYNYWTKGMKYPIAELEMTADFRNVLTASFIYEDNTFAETLKNNNPLRHYPNPASEKLYLINDSDKIFNVNIYNTIGEHIKSVQANSNKVEIDISSFSNGLYLYMIYNDKGEFINSSRFIKQ